MVFGRHDACEAAVVGSLLRGIQLAHTAASETCAPMDQQSLEPIVRNIDKRLWRVEQILPTLPTKDDVKTYVVAAIVPLATREYVATAIAAAVARLATKEYVTTAIETAIAPLATKAELAQTKTELRSEIREEGERTRRHFDFVAERLEGHIRLMAEGQMMLAERTDRRVEVVESELTRLDRRVTKLEGRQRPRNPE